VTLARACSVFLILLVTFPAQAQEEPKDTHVTDALSLFGEACVKQAGLNDQVATWALLHEMRELEGEASAYFLRGQKGTVWSAPTENGSYVLMTREPATCSVWAFRADAAEAVVWFEKLLHKSAQKSDVVEAAPVRNFEGAGNPYRLHAWRVRGDGGALLFTLTVTESDSDSVPAQLIASVSPVATEDKRP
jgi:hypothetical protein